MNIEQWIGDTEVEISLLVNETKGYFSQCPYLDGPARALKLSAGPEYVDLRMSPDQYAKLVYLMGLLDRQRIRS